MKLQLISDLHLDINRRFPLELEPQDDDTAVLIAGDTSGTPSEAIKWIRKNVKRGAVVTGNHICYNNLRRTYASLRRSFQIAFPSDGPVTYLDASCGTVCKDLGDVLVVGSTLYTDFELKSQYFPDGGVANNMRAAWSQMNDFNWGYTGKKRSKQQQSCLFEDGVLGRKYRYEMVRLTPNDYLKWHKEARKAMFDCIDANPGRDIVVLTHYCPSPKCISSNYVSSSVNASYASDLESEIAKRPQIKLWHCGHVHHKAHFLINGCHVLMNPRGYVPYYEYDPTWTPNLFIDTKTWEIEERPYKGVPKTDKLRQSRLELLFGLV